MGLYNGSCFISVNFSLHNERGRNKDKPYGLKKSELKKQYKKKRDKSTQGAIRKKELYTR